MAGHLGPWLYDVQLDDAAHVGMGSTALQLQVVGIVAQQVFQGELLRLGLGLRCYRFGLLRLGLDGQNAAIVPACMVLLRKCLSRAHRRLDAVALGGGLDALRWCAGIVDAYGLPVRLVLDGEAPIERGHAIGQLARFQ